jgi:hypothetical protein
VVPRRALHQHGDIASARLTSRVPRAVGEVAWLGELGGGGGRVAAWGVMEADCKGMIGCRRQADDIVVRGRWARRGEERCEDI